MTVTVPANYKPTEKEKYMNPVMLEYFRQKLLAWKAEIVRESNELLQELQDEGGFGQPFFDQRWGPEGHRWTSRPLAAGP